MLAERGNQPLLHFASIRGAQGGGREVTVRRRQPQRGRDLVDVGPERERHAPVRHGRGRIQRCRLRERPVRLFVIEAVEQRQAFIEEPLGLAVGGADWAVIRPEIPEQRCPWRWCIGSRGRMFLRGFGASSRENRDQHHDTKRTGTGPHGASE